MTNKLTGSLWQPTGETIEAIAASLSSHWAAAKSHPTEWFWPKPASWLRQQATRLVDTAASTAPADTYHLTSGGMLIR